MVTINYTGIILAEENRIKYLLPWLCVQSTGVQEFGCEVNVHIAKKENNIVSFPKSSTNI